MNKYEGEAFGFDYQTDYTAGSALIVYRLKEKQFETVWNPCDHFDRESVDEYTIDAAAKYLQKVGVQQLWTPGSDKLILPQKVDRLFGIELGWEWYETDEDGEIESENWGVFHSIGKDTRGRLSSYGITTRYLEAQGI